MQECRSVWRVGMREGELRGVKEWRAGHHATGGPLTRFLENRALIRLRRDVPRTGAGGS